jgi:hypothetical protein
MRCLRSLIFSHLIVALLYVLPVNAEPAQISNSVNVTSSKGTLRSSTASETQISGVQHRIDAATARSASGFKLGVVIASSQNDYSNYLVQDKIGNTKALSQTFDQVETNAVLAIDYAKGSHAVIASVGNSLTESPFAQSSASLSYLYKFNQDLSVVGLSVFGSIADQPENYSINTQNGRRITLPTEVLNQSIQVSYEQIITEKIKIFTSLEHLTKTARPSANSFTSRLAYALTERDFVKYELSRAEESSTETPSDNQGVFSLIGNEITYNRYITYDLLFGLGYGLTVESESSVDSPQVDRTATDSYQLSIAYQAKKFRVDLQSQFLASNTGYESQIIGGKFEWVF